MKQNLRLIFMTLLCAVFSTAWGQDSQVLFHESFGDNPAKARAWDDSYSVKSGVEAVYSGITSYTVSNVKQGKNTTGSVLSGLNQSSQGTDAYIIIGPLNVANYSFLQLFYQWKAASINGTYYTKAYYATSSTGSYNELQGSAAGDTQFVPCTYSLPEAAQVATLYIKIVFNTSNTQAIIDEVELTGVSSSTSSVAAPTFSVPEGTYYETKSVELSCETEGAYIYYTTDGTEPNATTGTLYSESESITISETTTLKAIAVKGEDVSNVATATYTIKLSAAPTFSLEGGTYNEVKTVAISTTIEGATIRYTTDESEPTATTGNEYSEPITISQTTTLKAIAVKNGVTSDVATAVYTLLIPEDGVFNFVAGTMDYGSGVSITNGSNDYITEAKTWTAGNVTLVTSGKYRWWYNGKELRFYSNDPQSAMTFSVPNGYVITNIEITGGTSWICNVGTYTTGSTGNWSGSSQSVQFVAVEGSSNFVRTVTVIYKPFESITIGDTGYATLYYGTENLVVPEGVEAYTCVANVNKTITHTTTFAKDAVAGNVIPAGTAVVLHGAAGSYNFIVSDNADNVNVGANMLYGFDDAATTSGPDANTQYRFYALSLNADDEAVGFYYVNARGAAFESGAHKAYLAVPEEIARTADASSFIFDENTGIKSMEAEKQCQEGVYTLSGVRMRSEQLPAGIYIVNGKKMVIK